jgi:hypothetical protein
MCCSPFVTQSLAADDSVRDFEGGAFWPVVLRLVRKELHRPAWQVEL